MDVCLQQLVMRRAAYQVRLKYDINRYELYLLMQLHALLMHLDRPFVSVIGLFRQITGNSGEWRKMNGYMTGLINRRYVGTFEYVKTPGSLSVGPSELGLAVIECYRVESSRLAAKFGPAESARVVSYEESMPKYYVPRVA
jgi:hypothetical protein